MKLKRTLSLTLSLLMVFSLFAGIAPAAQANDLIGDLLERYFFQKDYLEQLFNESNLVKQGYCGKSDADPDHPAANVWYQIYEVSAADLSETPFYQTLAEHTADGYLALDPAEDYYGVKIFGNGDMFDYTRTQSAPWCDKITLDRGERAGQTVDMDKKLIVGYVAGPGEYKVLNGNSFTNVTYKTGVTNVGQFAFFGQDMLSAVYLDSSVKRIEDRAFESTEMLAAINMPTALEYIGKRAFYGCDKLTFWRAGACSKLTEIRERAFYGCSLLATVQFPANLKTIGKMAFAWCRILGDENFALPSGLVTIGDGAFMFDTHMGRINEINIPRNVQTIGNYAFLCCFGIGKGENDGLSFTAGGTAPLSIGNYAFAGCRELKHLKLDNRVTQIHTGAFAACERLEDVIFGSDQNAKAVAIDANAFTSAQSNVVNALEYINGISAETGDEASEFIPTANYDSEELEAFTSLTAMTPLRNAAFQNNPASRIEIASAALTHSFPVDCVVHYPKASYNPTANTNWHNALDSGKTTWKGYQTAEDWTGHFHVFEATDTKPATHTQDGYTLYTCSICKETYTETIAKGHNYQEYSRREATCTEDGEVIYHCDREGCSEAYYVETLPATGHDPKTVVTVKAATCTEDGLLAGYCSRCGQYINEPIPAKGHNIHTNLMTVVEPTCTKDGYAYGKCVDCGAVISRDDPIILPASGAEHKWDAGKVTKPATCGAEGVRTYTCTVCGDTKTEAISATGNHTWNAGVVTKQPTATEAGVRTYTCTVCGATKTEAISPAAHTRHTWDEGVVTKAPTAARTGVRTYTCTVCGETTTQVIPAIFVDVKADSWYENAVDWALANDVTNGTDATHFSPSNDCTRAQMVTFLWRALGCPTPKRTTSPFTDVQNPNAYYYNAVLWAVEQNITAGTTPTTFSPNDKVTRAQTVTFLWRMEGQPPAGGRNPFTDVAASKYYYNAVLWAVANDITNGITATQFAPNDNCTRAQIVTFLQRDLGQI